LSVFDKQQKNNTAKQNEQASIVTALTTNAIDKYADQQATGNTNGGNSR